MGDVGDAFREHRALLRMQKEVNGIDCPGCIAKHPKRNPTRLLPGWRCKVYGYVRAKLKHHSTVTTD